MALHNILTSKIKKRSSNEEIFRSGSFVKEITKNFNSRLIDKLIDNKAP